MDDPPYLYHYTDAKALKSIVKEGKLRASDARYFNDATELLQLATFGVPRLEELAKTPANEFSEQAIQAVRSVLAPLGADHDAEPDPEEPAYVPFRTYVTSFSTQRDDLSQWRAYAGNGGYAIGIQYDQLRDLARAQGFALEQCHYVGETTESVDELIDEVVANVELELSELDDIGRKYGDEIAFHTKKSAFLDRSSALSYLLASKAPRFKHHAFKLECEWRLIAPDMESDHPARLEPQVNDAGGRHPLRPYVEFEIDLDKFGIATDEKRPLLDLVIGPTAHPRLAGQAVHDLLRQFRPSWRYGVDHTQAPFRP
jgi:hypothetical protein